MKFFSVNILAFLFLLQLSFANSDSEKEKSDKNFKHKESSTIGLNNLVLSKKFSTDKENIKLEKLKLFFALVPENAKIKIRIQEVDNQTKLPGKDINSNEILFSPDKKYGWNTLELETQNINIQNKEFYLTLECVNCVLPDFYSDAYLKQSLALAIDKKAKSEFLIRNYGQENWETMAAEPMIKLSYSK